MDEPVGTLRVAVEGDTAMLSDDMDRAYRIGEKFGSAIRGAFTGAIDAVHEFLGALGPLGDVLTGAGIAMFLRHSMELADQLDDTAKRLNVNVEALQAYQVAALEAGIKTARLEQGLNRLTDTVGNALQNNKAAIETFQKLGVAVTDVNGQTRATDRILADVVRSLGEMEDQTKAAAIANDLFGRGGAQLARALKDATEDADAYIAKLKEAGLVLDAEVIQKAGEAADKMELAGRAFQMVGVSIMANVSPAIIALMGYVDQAIKGIVEMARVLRILAPDADELARRLGEINTTIQEQQQLAAYGNVGAAQYVEILKRQRDELREQLRAVMALDAAERDRRAKQGGPAPAGAPLAFDNSKAVGEAAERDREAIERATLAGEERYKAMYKREGEQHYKTLEEFSKLELDDRKKTLDAKTKRDEDAAKSELQLQKETDSAVNALRIADDKTDQASIDARAKREEDAAKQELQLQQEIDAAMQAARLTAMKTEDAQWADRLQLFHAGFAALDRALTGAVSGILQGTQTVGEAFKRMGQNILVAITETIIQQGLKELEKAIEQLVKSQAFQDFITMALGFLGIGAAPTGTGAGGGLNIEATQSIYMGTDPLKLATGGIVQSPTLALVGERGPEAVVPLDQYGAGGGVQVNIINQTSTPIEGKASTRRGPNGNEIHDIVIREMRRMVGSGEMESVMAPYNLRRQPTGR